MLYCRSEQCLHKIRFNDKTVSSIWKLRSKNYAQWIDWSKFQWKLVPLSQYFVVSINCVHLRINRTISHCNLIKKLSNSILIMKQNSTSNNTIHSIVLLNLIVKIWLLFDDRFHHNVSVFKYCAVNCEVLYNFFLSLIWRTSNWNWDK